LTACPVVNKMQSVVFSTFPIVRLWRARRRVDGVSSGGFTLKLMKLTLRPPLAPTGPFQGPERGPSNVLEMPQSRTAHIYEKKLDRGFPIFDNSAKNGHYQQRVVKVKEAFVSCR
jgi:hypothetical protein